MGKTVELTYPRGRRCQECGSQLEIEVTKFTVAMPRNRPPTIRETRISCPNNHLDPEPS